MRAKAVIITLQMSYMKYEFVEIISIFYFFKSNMESAHTDFCRTGRDTLLFTSRIPSVVIKYFVVKSFHFCTFDLV